MAKAKRMYGCTECGATFPKWAGQCADCGAWNTLVETVVEAAPSGSGRGGWAGQQANLKTLAEVSVEEMPRFTTGSTELDRVLGGGLVDGSVEKTRQKFHANDGVNLYGQKVNGVLLGQGI